MADSVLSPIIESVFSAKSIFLVFPQNAGFDKMAAGLSLYQVFKKMGKNVEMASVQPIRVEFSSLVGVDKIKNSLGGQNLVVSFDYVEDSVDRVSYNIEGNRFNLVIQPKEGFPPLSSEKVKFFNSGLRADLIVLIGVNDIAKDLGNFYQQEKQAFDETKTVVITDVPTGSFGSRLVLDINGSSCFTEAVGRLIIELKVPVDEDLAGTMLQGLEAGTRGFSTPKTGATAFEMAGYCLRAGGKRRMVNNNGQKPTPASTEGLQPMPKSVSAATAPATEQPANPADTSSSKNADWLAPKIYQGETKL